MSAEHIRSTHERTRRAPTDETSSEAYIIAPVTDTEGASSEAIDAVRERLGLSRREMLAGAVGAVVVAAAPEAHARTRAERLERAESYEDGVAFLRERARTQEVEDLYLYATDGTHARWIEVPGTTLGTPGSSERGGGGLLGATDRQFTYRMQHMVRGGETVEMLHTHPTPLLMRETGNSLDADLLKRVPPSGLDIVSMVATERPLDDEARSRLSFSAVTEEGKWTYESDANSSIERSVAAAEPSLALLEGVHARHARAAAREMRDGLETLYGSQGALRGHLRTLERSIAQGSYPASLRANPSQLLMHRDVIRAILAADDVSSGARDYLETVVAAGDALDQESRELDPGGHSFADLASAMPLAGDAGSDFAPYQEFWRARGVALGFEPFV